MEGTTGLWCSLLPMLGLALSLTLLSAPAPAGDDLDRAWDSCLEAAGLPPRRAAIWVVGPESRQEVNTYGTLVTGLWELQCDGSATFDDRVISSFRTPPVNGRVLDDKVPKAALRCYVDTCIFPAGVCPGRSGEDPVVEACEGGELTGAMLSSGPGERPAPAAPAAEDLADPSISPPAPTIRVTPVTPAPELDAAPQTVVIELATPDPEPLDMEFDDLLEIPPRPEIPCDTSSALKAESRAHLELGNQAELVGEVERAAAEYRAALSISPCNGFAWVALGLLAERLERPDRAVRALEVALELEPGHYGAATALGRAYEQLGHDSMAASAYRAALEARPDHQPAVDGLRRVQ